MSRAALLFVSISVERPDSEPDHGPHWSGPMLQTLLQNVRATKTTNDRESNRSEMSPHDDGRKAAGTSTLSSSKGRNADRISLCTWSAANCDETGTSAVLIFSSTANSGVRSVRSKFTFTGIHKFTGIQDINAIMPKCRCQPMSEIIELR